ncbi:MAG: hypothetical protein ACYTFY_13900 [Planctomycetota bacterium]|jgi:hypothetical protein
MIHYLLVTLCLLVPWLAPIVLGGLLRMGIRSVKSKYIFVPVGLIVSALYISVVRFPPIKIGSTHDLEKWIKLSISLINFCFCYLFISTMVKVGIDFVDRYIPRKAKKK